MMKRKPRFLWRWCLVLAVLVNTVVPVWAGAAMAAELLNDVSQQAASAGDDPAASGGEAGCASDTRQPGSESRSGHDGCDCGSTGTCACPCAFSVKLIDVRVEFAARHLLSTIPGLAAWESADSGPRTSVFRPPIA
jgi:hypothetical protein